MKIGKPADNTSLPATASTVAQTRATPADVGKTGQAAGAPTAVAAQPRAEASATVALSNTASQLLEGVGASLPEFDTQKVSRISQAITERKFTVNAELIADKLIANAQELLSKAAR